MLPSASFCLILTNCFFDPYSIFIGKDRKYLIEKTNDVLDIWETIYREATKNRTIEGAKLEIYFHKGFPSKSLYRFDDTIVSTPTVMIQNKSPIMPTICCQRNENPNCAFNAYYNEIKWLVANSTKYFDLTYIPLNQQL